MNINPEKLSAAVDVKQLNKTVNRNINTNFGSYEDFYNTPQEILAFNPLAQVVNSKDREFWQGNDGKDIINRVKTRNTFRSLYGRPFLEKNGRELNDTEVDTMLRKFYDIPEDQDLDFGYLKKDLDNQHREKYDKQDFTTGEFLAGTGAVFVNGAEKVLEFLATQGVRAVNPNKVSIFNTPGVVLAKQIYQITNKKYNREEETPNSIATDFLDRLEYNIPGAFNLLTENAKFNMYELQTFDSKTGGIGGYLKEVATTLASNADVLTVGATLPFFVAMPYMMIREGLDFEEQKRKEAGLKDYYSADEWTPEIADKAETIAQSAFGYGVISGMIEYAQVLTLLKTNIGTKYATKRMSRPMLNSVRAFFKAQGYSAIENVGEESLQQIASNLFTNKNNKTLNDKYNLGLPESIYWARGVSDAVDGALKMTVGMGLVGGAKSTYSRYFGQTKQWILDKQEMLMNDFGLNEKEAKQYAIRLGRARASERATKALVKEIFEVSEISAVKEAGRRNRIREQYVNKVLGIASNNGLELSDRDFERLAIIFTEAELKEMSPQNSDVFVRAVYGDQNARKQHNNEILKQTILNLPGQVGDANTQETRSTQETINEIIDKYDFSPEVNELINKIKAGFFDTELETTGNSEADTLVDRRKAAIQKVLDLHGTLKKGEQRTETADVEDDLLDDFSVVKSEAERLGVEVEGDKRTSEYKVRLRRAVEKARAEERADEQQQDVDDVDKRRKENRRQKFLNKMLQKGRKALSVLAPNVKIKYAKDARDFQRITRHTGRGWYDMKDTIWLNPDSATMGTLAHEITHAIFHQRLKTDARIRYVANRILNDMIDFNHLDESVVIRIKAFQQQYRDKKVSLKDLDEEGLAELVGIMVDSFENLIPRTQNKIKAWLRKIFGNWLPSLKNNETALKMLQVIGAKTSRGEAILESDVALLDQLGQEKTDLELSEESTQEGNDKFQLSYYDPITNLYYFYDADLFNLYKKLGHLTTDKKPSDFAGQKIVLHSPDSMFSGNIYRDDVLLIKGQGGVYYPIKYLQQGYFWASTKQAAEALARLLNESADGQGKVLMGLTNGGREKLFSSSNGSIGVVNLFENLIDSGQISMTKEQFSYVLIRASSELNQVSGDINKVKGMLAGRYIDPVTKDPISFERRKQFTLDVIRKVAEVAKGNAKLEYELRTFYKSIIVNDIPISKSTGEIVDSKSLFTLGRLHLSEMMTEPTLKNELESEDRLDREAVGDLYAILEMQGTVEAIATPEHDTYGYSIVSTSGQKPVLHMLSQRSNYKDSIVDINGNSLVPTEEQIKEELKNGKAKNVRDAALNIERRIYPTTGTSTQVLRVSDQPGKAQLAQTYKVYRTKKGTATVKATTGNVLGDAQYYAFTEKDAAAYTQGVTENVESVEITVNNPYIIGESPDRWEADMDFADLIKAAEEAGYKFSSVYGSEESDGITLQEYLKSIGHDSLIIKNIQSAEQNSIFRLFGVMADISGTGNLVQVTDGSQLIVFNTETNFDAGKQQLSTSVNAATFFSGTRTMEFPMISNKLINWKLAVEYEKDINDLANGIFNTDFEAKDITKMNPKDFLNQNLEFMHFSPPCQFFSKLSKTEKSKMTPQQLAAATKLELEIAKKVAEFIEVIKPNNLTIENVPGYILSPHWNDVIRPALVKAGYKVEAVKTDPAYYGGISQRERVIVRATRVKNEDGTFVDFPSLPKETGPGDFKKAFAPYIKELPVEPVEEFGEIRTGKKGEGTFHVIIAKLLNDQYSNMEKYARSKQLFYIGTGDGTFVPEGYASQVLTAGWQFEDSKRGEKDKVGRKVKKTVKRGKDKGQLYGASNQGRIGIPATYEISKLMDKYSRQQSLKIFAEKYGCSIKEANDAFMSPTGYLFKRINTKILLIAMGFDASLSEVMSDRLSLNAAVLGNGMHGLTTKYLVEPMIGWDGKQSVDFKKSTKDKIVKQEIVDEVDTDKGKFSLSNDRINELLTNIREGNEQREKENTEGKKTNAIVEEAEEEIEEETLNPEDIAEEAEEENIIDDEPTVDKDEYQSSQEFYEDNVDTDTLSEDEKFDDNFDNQKVFQLRIQDIQRILEHYNLDELERSQQVKFSTLLAEAAKFLQRDSTLAFKIAQSINKEPRALTGIEHAIILVRTAQLVDQIEEIHISESRATKPTTINAGARSEALINELQDIIRADGLAGSISGQQLAARRMALHGNNTVAGILRRMERAKKNNKKSTKVSKEDTQKAADLASEHKKATEAVEKKQKEIEAERNKETKDESETFIEKEKKKRGTKAAKKLLSREKEIRLQAKELGFDLKGFGKGQAFSINIEQAKIIRELAKILVYKNLKRYDNIDNIVDEIKNALPSATEYDILNAIAGNIQRRRISKTDAQKKLERITRQSNKLQAIQDKMEELFGSKPSSPPTRDDFKALKNQLNDMYDEITSADDYDPIQTNKLLVTISQLGMLVDGYYKSVEKPSKKKIDNINKISDIITNTKKAVKLLDRIELLRGIIEGTVLPVDNDREGPARTEENKKIQRLRARVAQLEDKIKQDKKDKKEKETKENNEAELQELVREILGWYRKNKTPKEKKPKSDISKAKEQAKREQRLQDTLAELEAILLTGKLPPEMYGKLYKKKAQVADPFKFRESIQEVRQEIKETEYYKQLEDFKWANKRKETIRKRLDELNRILEEGDFESFKKPKREREMDQELLDLLDAQRIAERKITRAIDELRERTLFETVGDYVSLPRAFAATADISVIFRQALFLGTAMPKEYLNAVQGGLKGIGVSIVDGRLEFTDKIAKDIMLTLENDEMHFIREKAGLFFSAIDTGLTASEEAFNSRALEKVYNIKGVGNVSRTVMGASERNMVITLNLLRAAAFDGYYELNPHATDAELKKVAFFINIASGRGNLGKSEAAMQSASFFFFSPRFALSRVQLPFWSIYAGLQIGRAKYSKDQAVKDRIRAEGFTDELGLYIAKSWARFGATMTGIITLAVLAGASFGFEPEEEDFMKISIGKLRLDIFGGMGPVFRFWNKFNYATFSNLTGRDTDIDVWNEFQKTFIKYKVSPWMSKGSEIMTGKDYVTQRDINEFATLLELFVPIHFANAVEGIITDVPAPYILGETVAEMTGIGAYAVD
tara:strand:- start:321 stop:9695 length:9375 start_codon:yes stop_codon:yes gene_type:complete